MLGCFMFPSNLPSVVLVLNMVLRAPVDLLMGSTIGAPTLGTLDVLTSSTLWTILLARRHAHTTTTYTGSYTAGKLH